jgi:hypothetical protein
LVPGCSCRLEACFTLLFSAAFYQPQPGKYHYGNIDADMFDHYCAYHTKPAPRGLQYNGRYAQPIATRQFLQCTDVPYTDLRDPHHPPDHCLCIGHLLAAQASEKVNNREKARAYYEQLTRLANSTAAQRPELEIARLYLKKEK